VPVDHRLPVPVSLVRPLQLIDLVEQLPGQDIGAVTPTGDNVAENPLLVAPGISVCKYLATEAARTTQVAIVNIVRPVISVLVDIVECQEQGNIIVMRQVEDVIESPGLFQVIVTAQGFILDGQDPVLVLPLLPSTPRLSWLCTRACS
jgi:hypothetical protein